MSTFVVECYTPGQDCNFYACLNKGQHFVNQEEDITYLKCKGGVIVFGGVNACTRSLQLDAQQSFIPRNKDARGYTNV